MTKNCTHLSASDEVGFGCMAGPMHVAAFLAPVDWEGIPGLRDSKTLTKSLIELRARELLRLVTAGSDGTCKAAVHVTRVDEIDKKGVYVALNKAHVTAHNRLDPYKRADRVADGNLKLSGHGIRSVVKADATILHAMAAAIIAKYVRDMYMTKIVAPKYPEYGFERHMGYVTKEHQAALQKHGPIRGVHRASYAPVAKVAAERGWRE